MKTAGRESREFESHPLRQDFTREDATIGDATLGRIEPAIPRPLSAISPPVSSGGRLCHLRRRHRSKDDGVRQLESVAANPLAPTVTSSSARNASARPLRTAAGVVHVHRSSPPARPPTQTETPPARGESLARLPPANGPLSQPGTILAEIGVGPLGVRQLVTMTALPLSFTLVMSTSNLNLPLPAAEEVPDRAAVSLSG